LDARPRAPFRSLLWAYNGSSVLTAKEENPPSLPKTRVWGSDHFFPTLTRRSAPPSSTLDWGWTLCSYEIVVERLVGKYFPYGQERPSATQDGKEKFATYFRDAETGLDYANNRYHQPGMGRFMTPDPYMASGGPSDPGSWNRYAYTRGDPVNRVDPGGLEDENCPYLACTEVTDYYDRDLSFSDPTLWNLSSDIPIGMFYEGCSTQSWMPLGCPPELGGGVTQQGTPGNAGFAAAQSDMGTFATMQSTPQCENFLMNTFGVGLTDIQAAAGGYHIIDGTTDNQSVLSAVGNAGANVGNINQLQANMDVCGSYTACSATVAQWLAAKPGIMAFSEPGGNHIYVNSTFPADSSGVYIIFHEVLHVMFGLTDGQLAAAIGATIGPGNTTAISDTLSAQCPNGLH
jgi:RHS repeat-associated protein